MAAAKKFDLEKSLANLEELVEELESGDLPLETAMKKFEEGIKLTRGCQTALKEAEIQRVKNVELQAALDKIKQLSGMLPICANCKKIRDDKGYWHDVAVFIRKHSEADFSHGICPECAGELYPELFE